MKELTIQHYKAGTTWAFKDNLGKQIYSGLSNILDGYCVRRKILPQKLKVIFSTEKFPSALVCLSYYRLDTYGNAVYHFQSYTSTLHPSIWQSLTETEKPPTRLYLKFELEF